MSFSCSACEAVFKSSLVLGLVPWCLVKGNGFEAVLDGLGGVDDNHRSLFDPWIAFSMGIPLTIGLIAAPIADQQFFQRAMAFRRETIGRTFVFGGLAFGLVPLSLSMLGFLAAPLAREGAITVDDPQIVGAVVVGHLLPRLGLLAFCVMAFAGLCSTLDSTYCAGSSLAVVDVYKRYMKPNASDAEIVRLARTFMIGLAIIGTGIALLQPKVLWVFLVIGALSSAGLFPTLFSLYSSRMTARGAWWAIVLSLIFGTPLSVYANVNENPYLVVTAVVLSVGIGLVVCTLTVLTNRKELFDFDTIAQGTNPAPKQAAES